MIPEVICGYVPKGTRKHSLGTRDYDEAMENLRALDRCKAVEFGLTDGREMVPQETIGIADGWQRYLDHASRAEVLGGVSPSTLRRYKAVRDKHAAFCARHAIAAWNDFSKLKLEQYGNWLKAKHYAPRTQYLELTMLKSVLAWLIDEGHLPPSQKIRLPLQRLQGTDTYCFKRAEVAAIVEYCRAHAELKWLADVAVGLACTGLRIGELAGLRWSDVDLASNMIRVRDERASGRKAHCSRRTKGRRSRCLPIHPDLRAALEALPRQGEGRVFRAIKGGTLTPTYVLRIFTQKVIKPLSERFPTPPGEIGFADGRLHGFRHYFCSQAFLDGASEGEIRKWLGHATSQMVEHYRHLHDEDSQRKMRQINFLGGKNGQCGTEGAAC